MVPMTITPEEYCTFHSPMPNYLFVLRRLDNYEKLGRIRLPDRVVEESRKFIPTGRILKISDYPSDDEHIESLKEILKGRKYVGFEFHAIAPVHLLPQFAFPKGDDVVMLHVRDITIIDENLDELIERQRLWEEKEMTKIQTESVLLTEEVEKIRSESKEWQKERVIQKP